MSEESKAMPPCEVTGRPCWWVCDETYDEGGELYSWDDFCVDCGQWRDWSKAECPE